MIVELEVREVEKEISEGVRYTFWTFGGTVPGSFIRVRQGDTVEFHLKNHPDNKMPHNIDLHGVTGPGGGAASSFTAPGHESQFTFKALNQGIYVYHCATAPVGMHIANGMYGLILVEPPEGLPPVDHEYYVMQGDFYTVGKYREKGIAAIRHAEGHRREAHLRGLQRLRGLADRRQGAHGQGRRDGAPVRRQRRPEPRLVSFHVIGEIFDKVCFEGGTRYQENVQTTLIPAGGAAIAEFHTRRARQLRLVDHSIFRAFNKGALGILKVEGPENKTVYSGKEVDSVYLGDKAAEPGGGQSRPQASTEQRHAHSGPADQGRRGALRRHLLRLPPGQRPGTRRRVPAAWPGRTSCCTTKARHRHRAQRPDGPVTVNGKTYNSVMPPMSQLNDDEIANILTYVTHSWGN